MLVCFDIGGVLVRITQSWAAAFEQLNLPAPESSGIGLPDLEALNEYQAGTLDYGEYLAALATSFDLEPALADPLHRAILIDEYPGVAELVRDLKRRGIPTACLSNTNQPHWERLTDPAEFPTVASLDHRIASHNLRLGKPDPAIYHRFEQITGSKPSEIVFFDDSHANVRSAQNCGWTAYRIDPFGDPAAQMRSALAEVGILTLVA